MEIKVGVVGKVMDGKEVGRYVKVIDDESNTGGFLILTASSPKMQDGFDNWVENRQVLQLFFEEAGWIIEWDC